MYLGISLRVSLAVASDGIGLTGAFTDGLRRLRPRGTGHDPGRIAVDLAVMLADGGEAIADLALLRDQIEVFGLVALLSTTHSALPNPVPTGSSPKSEPTTHDTLISK